MVAHIKRVAFLGVNAVSVAVQVHLAPGHNAFNMVGLADKSGAESRERVCAALSAMGLAHQRQFRAPHNSASMAALVGGGRYAGRPRPT